jgi:hypothetical protein
VELFLQVLQEQQKNMMAQLGQVPPVSMSTIRAYLAGAGTQASALAFGGTPPNTAATEEWTGPGAPLTQTITVS